MQVSLLNDFSAQVAELNLPPVTYVIPCNAMQLGKSVEWLESL